MQVTIDVDAGKAFARFSSGGIPETVRNNLRRLMPQLGKTVGDMVEHRLDSDLKSRTSLTVQKQMVENTTSVAIRITTVSSKNPMLPTWLDQGTAPHEIVAKGNALYFYWDRLGKNVAFKRVMHPGFKGIQFKEKTLAEAESLIVDTLNRGVAEGA